MESNEKINETTTTVVVDTNDKQNESDDSDYESSKSSQETTESISSDNDDDNDPPNLNRLVTVKDFYDLVCQYDDKALIVFPCFIQFEKIDNGEFKSCDNIEDADAISLINIGGFIKNKHIKVKKLKKKLEKICSKKPNIHIIDRDNFISAIKLKRKIILDFWTKISPITTTSYFDYKNER